MTQKVQVNGATDSFGRVFTPEDAVDGTRVVIVSEAKVERAGSAGSDTFASLRTTELFCLTDEVGRPLIERLSDARRQAEDQARGVAVLPGFDDDADPLEPGGIVQTDASLVAMTDDEVAEARGAPADPMAAADEAAREALDNLANAQDDLDGEDAQVDRTLGDGLTIRGGIIKYGLGLAADRWPTFTEGAEPDILDELDEIDLAAWRLHELEALADVERAYSRRPTVLKALSIAFGLKAASLAQSPPNGLDPKGNIDVFVDAIEADVESNRAGDLDAEDALGFVGHVWAFERAGKDRQKVLKACAVARETLWGFPPNPVNLEDGEGS